MAVYVWSWTFDVGRLIRSAESEEMPKKQAARVEAGGFQLKDNLELEN